MVPCIIIEKKVAVAAGDGGNGMSAAEAVDRGSVSLTQMNNYIADCMIDTWYPTSILSYYDRYGTRGLATKTLSYQRPISLKPFEPHDFVTSLCPLPGNKFLELYTARSPASDKRAVPPVCYNLSNCLSISYSMFVVVVVVDW
jgi:hypothetical protein